jgi:hypothetical protein
MTISSRSHFFGFSNYGVVQGTRFACGISIAPEGMFKGYSVLISYFNPQLTWREAYEKGELTPTAKATLHPTLTKTQRGWVLDGLLKQLDMPDGQDLGLACAIYANFLALKDKGYIIDFFLHPMAQQLVDEALNQSQESHVSAVV